MGAPPREQPSSLVSGASGAGSDTVVWLRDRLKSLEQKLKATQGVVDVWKSKTEKALERENFLMSEVKRIAEGMQCKLQFPAPESSCLLSTGDFSDRSAVIAQAFG